MNLRSKGIASICLVLFSIFSLEALGFNVSSQHRDLSPEEILAAHNFAQKLKIYDGMTISKIQFVGLVRTRETALRWIMKLTENKPFSSNVLAKDIQNLANTGVIYNLVPIVTPTANSTTEVELTIQLEDKWTLLPVFGSQGGGGAVTYGGGLLESNLFGWLINAQALGYNYNGVFSYDVNFNQEYIAGTQTMGWLDWSNNVNPTVIHNIDGSSAGSFTWQRQQEEIMIGSHWYNGFVRPMLTVDLYYDSLTAFQGVNVSTFAGTQYRVQPKIIFGRSDIVEFLEDGYELTFHPSTANFFGPIQAYQGIDGSFKKVVRFSNNNLAFFIFAGAMSLAPAPYEYQVGGYLNLRGYIDSRQIGPYTTYANAEYRPLFWLHHFSLPLDTVAIQGCVFSDAGSAWGDSALTGDQGAKQFRPLWSAGLGFRLNFLHYAGAIMRLDVARTISPDEGFGLSFGVGQFF